MPPQPPQPPESTINLLLGHPHPTLFPTLPLLSASTLTLSSPHTSIDALSYGPALGYPPLRHALCQWLTSFYQTPSPILVDRICITGGASQNLGRILETYSDASYTRVWMGVPGYFLAGGVFADHGFAEGGRVKGVPEDKTGEIDMSWLRESLRKCHESDVEGGVRRKPDFKTPRTRPHTKIYAHIIYLTPTFSNPSSLTLSLAKREELVRLARSFDALIICDDVYDFLQWSASPTSSATMKKVPTHTTAIVPRIVDVDRYLEGGAEKREGTDGFGNAVSNGSFSKIAGPGLRTGWVEGTEGFALGLAKSGTTRSGGAPSQLTAAIIANLMSSGDLQNHITSTLIPAYSARYHTMLAAITKHLIPLGVSITNKSKDPQAVVGGYFIWISLPNKVHCDEVTARAKREETLVVAPGSLFGVQGEDGERYGLEGKLRLCFSWEDERLLEEGIERLGRVIEGMQRDSRSGERGPGDALRGEGREIGGGKTGEFP